MDRYYTVMIIPEREKKVRSFKIPRLMVSSFSVIVVIALFSLFIFAYDYKQVMDQVYENKHLAIENRKLRDQLNIFQMKITSFTEELNRVHTFEKKLRVITGIDTLNSQQNLFESKKKSEPLGQIQLPSTEEELNSSGEFQKLKGLYDFKIANAFGLQKSYPLTKEWNQLNKQSFALASKFAKFDFIYKKLSQFVTNLELKIHQIDQFLLDKDSFVKSTPTILPTRGWITSYYGPRKSPYSGRIKMHEGLDIGAKMGTPILAPADGVITFSGQKPGFGRFVQIDHGYGVETIFGHAQTLLVKKGQKVSRGFPVAKVGNTGISTGPHLHYEVRVNGIAVDPFYFILDYF